MSKLDLCTLLLPEIVVLLTAFIALFTDMTFMRGQTTRARMRRAGIITVIGCLLAIVWLSQTGDPPITIYDGPLTVSRLTQFVKQIILVLTVFTALLSLHAEFTNHAGEYFLLLLMASLGGMFLVSAENLLMIFLALELLSLCLYLLTAFNKSNIRSAEAALKYFLFGGMAAAFMLFGLSLIYGLSGSLQLQEIATALKGKTTDPLLLVALIMTIVGFGFKVAAVPFHLWAPDAYEGAPLPSAAFIASASKVASFFILAKVMMVGFAGAEGKGAWLTPPGWITLLAVLALLSVVVGNLAAIAQRSVRRLLAYSAVAHAGYAMVGILANNRPGIASLLYYVATYGLTTIGAFAVVGIVQERTGVDRFSSFAGLSKRAPFVAFCMMIFMLSLAGIPPLAGFFGKFYLFTAALSAAPADLGLRWLVIAAVAMSAVSLYYYLQVLKQIYVADAGQELEKPRVDYATQIAVGIIAAAVLVLGCAPDLLLEKLRLAIGVQ